MALTPKRPARTTSTAAAEALPSGLARLQALNKELQALHHSHNDVRRLMVLMMAELVALLSTAAARSTDD